MKPFVTPNGVEILDIEMPSRLQELIIDSFDSNFKSPHAEKAYFTNQGRNWLSKLVGVEFVRTRHNFILGTEESGRTLNSQLHPDNRDQFLIVISETAGLGTIAFLTQDEESYHQANKKKSQELFVRNSCGVLTPNHDFPLGLEYVQAPNGSVIYIPKNTLHAAAPLFKGEKKILIGAHVRP